MRRAPALQDRDHPGAAEGTLVLLRREAEACLAAGETARALHMFRSILALDPRHGPRAAQPPRHPGARGPDSGRAGADRRRARDGGRACGAARGFAPTCCASSCATTRRWRPRIGRSPPTRGMRSRGCSAATSSTTGAPSPPPAPMPRWRWRCSRISREARFRLAELALLHGDYPEGWAGYGWNERTRMAQPLIPPAFSTPGQLRWQGEQLGGGTLLLVADQGYGDMIQFSRYLPWVRDRCGRLAIVGPLPTMPIIRQIAPEATLCAVWETVPPFAAWTALSSLPRPARHDGRHHSAADPADGRVGGGARVAGAARRPVSAADRPAADRPGLGRPAGAPQRLQPLHQPRRAGAAARAGRDVLRLPAAGPRHGRHRRRGRGCAAAERVGPLLGDFGATAALIENLDLVITIDSAVAHLAGAMGKPVWVMLPYAPEWRWMLDRPDTPWYPRHAAVPRPGTGGPGARLRRRWRRNCDERRIARRRRRPGSRLPSRGRRGPAPHRPSLTGGA